MLFGPYGGHLALIRGQITIDYYTVTHERSSLYIEKKSLLFFRFSCFEFLIFFNLIISLETTVFLLHKEPNRFMLGDLELFFICWKKTLVCYMLLTVFDQVRPLAIIVG